jgi:phosphoribosyl 1,2-cyclic phosphodiesterase
VGMSMSVRFWGVRGSCPSPGPETVEVGGNTSCVEVVCGETRIVLDAGTGLRRLGNELLGRGPVDVTVLLSHVHWDHIQGLPFFAPIFAKTTKLRVISGASGTPLRETMRRQMSSPMFPVDLDDVPSALAFDEVREHDHLRIGDADVTLARANHTDPVYAYRVEHGGRSVVYATDTEHYACVDHRLAKLAAGADLLVYDAQYLPDEYTGESGMSRVGWGHSTYEAGVALARAAGVSRLVLFHHDPSRDDEGVRAIEAKTRALFAESCAAREGMRIDLGDVGTTLAA